MISHEVNYFVDSKKRTEKREGKTANMAVKTGDFDFEQHMEQFDSETSAIHRKLQSKVEALKIMKNEMEKFRSERDQFKVMAETLQMRYTALKNSVNGPELQETGLGHNSAVSLIVNQTRQHNMSLSTEVEALRQRILELEGDIKVLRTKNTDLQAICSKFKSAEDMILKENGTTFFQKEKSKLICQMEKLKKKNAQLQYDFRALLDEKEELVVERDAYKCKAHRLNHELSIVLKGDKSQQQMLDIDGLILENKYQQEKILNLENELELAKQSATKYKNMLDTNRKKGIIKLGSSNNQTIMSHTQVKKLLERGTVDEIPLKAATISELKSLCRGLLDNVNDKSLALSHQKKTNKLLAAKIAELEQRINTLTGNNEAGVSCLSPSQILLNGYSSATVDLDVSEELKQLKVSAQSQYSDSGGGAACEASSSNTSQGLPAELLSSESNKSLPSCSEVGDREYVNESSSDSTSNGEEIGGTRLGPYGNADIKWQSSGSKLPELPPEIAALVQQLIDGMDDSAISAN
ncbi:coiled-coil domain-containing protein 149 [Sabethes cyaneus]|uniref:coiled-coil domain-containing protein 149 n=1 Tax=Sabethes cyaneus TaxID=53552 RepID=UPI00237EE586|nr:coiled-coil domain-containing protein 149 [Sabethes cyaneus]